jgi:hypothetical protein
MRLRSAVSAALIFAAALSAPAHADPSLAQSGTAPHKHSILVTYGDDVCPQPVGDEIIVCAQQPESERYRVPKDLRGEDEPAPVGGASWGSRVEAYDDIARVTRPDSCSAVGSYGSTGCMAAALRQWHAEKRQNP